MDEETTAKLLSSIPGALRASDGVIIPLPEGGIFHITNIWDKAATEGLTSEEQFLLNCCSRTEILRLRELKSAHDYLLRIRANAIADSARAVRLFSRRRSNFDNGRGWSLTQYYHSKDHHHKSYARLLAKKERRIVSAIPAGLALIADANAVCIRTLVGDVVLVSEALEWFYYFMIVALYGNQFGIGPQDRASAAAIAVRIMGQSEALDFDLDSRGELPDAAEREIRKLVGEQMRFTFGHEFAHALCGHVELSDNQMSDSLRSYRDQSPEAMRLYSHEIEFEADLFAVRHVHQNRKAQGELVRGGINVFLSLYFLEAVCATGVDGVRLSSSTHPGPLDRLWRLWTEFQSISGFTRSDVEDAIGTCLQVRTWFERWKVGTSRKDLLSFYGSVYLPSFKKKRETDRIDF